MPFPTSRLDLFVVPQNPYKHISVERVESFWVSGMKLKWWDDKGRPGEHHEALGVGSFGRIRLERVNQRRFYGNQQGGFRVECPFCGAPLVKEFHEKKRKWVEDGQAWLRCHRCEQHLALTNLRFLPPAAFAPCAVHLQDVGRFELSQTVRDALADAFGDVRLVGRRAS